MTEKITILALLMMLIGCNPNNSENLSDESLSLIRAEKIEADRNEYQDMIELSQTLQKYAKVNVSVVLNFESTVPMTMKWVSIDTIKTKNIAPISFLSLNVPSDLKEQDKTLIGQALIQVEEIIALRSVSNSVLTEFEMLIQVEPLPEEEARNLELKFEFDGSILAIKYLNKPTYDQVSSIAKNWIIKRIDYTIMQDLKHSQ